MGKNDVKAKDRKRKRSSSTSLTDSEDSDIEESSRKKSKIHEKKKHKKDKKKKKEKKRKKDKKKKQDKDGGKRKSRKYNSCEAGNNGIGPLPTSSSSSTNIPESTKPQADEDDSARRRFAPMTKEEWEKQQNTLRRVVDPETGRNRLIKGSGEVMEEIVSKKQHKLINQQATLHDGMYYQSQMRANH